MKSTEYSLNNILIYGFYYSYMFANHPEMKEGEIRWQKLIIRCNNKVEFELKEFEQLLKQATEEELIQFFTTARLVFIDEKAKEMYGERGEKYFQAIIPKLYEKYKLLLT